MKKNFLNGRMILPFFITFVALLLNLNIVKSAETPNVRVLNHAYCGCTGKIELTFAMCNGTPEALNPYQVLLRTNDGTPILIDNGTNYSNSPNLINGEYKLILENLCPGTYGLTLQIELAGMWRLHVNNQTVTIKGGGPFSVDVDVNDQPCFAEASADISITGGDPPFTIQRCDGSHKSISNSTTHQAKNLEPGNYCYKITNYWGCEQTVNFNVANQGQNINFDLDYNEINCGNLEELGWAQISNITGTSDYVIRWYDDDNGVIGDEILQLKNTTSATNLEKGCYWVEITDRDYGCVKAFKFCINYVPYPDTEPEVKNAGCNSLEKGSIEMKPNTQGTTYNWYKKDANGNFIFYSQLPSDTYKLENLDPGEYKVCAFININCQKCTTVTITQVEPFEAIAYVKKNQGCNSEDQDGEIEIYISGGTKPYKIKKCDSDDEYNYKIIEENENSQLVLIEHLPAGVYCFEIEDAGGCPPIITEVNITAVENKLNFGFNSMTIKEGGSCYSIAKISNIQGVPPYLVEWLDDNDNVTNSTANWNGQEPAPEQRKDNLPTDHIARITDGNGCTRTYKIHVPACSMIAKGVVNVYANPTANIANVDVVVDLGPKNVKIKFFNLDFVEVKMTDHGIKPTGTFTAVENLTALSPGLYYVGAYFDNQPVGQFRIVQVIP